MGGRNLLLYTSSRSSLIKPSSTAAYLQRSIMRYSTDPTMKGGLLVEQERASSTAEEFRRVAEQKAQQGVASKTSEKAYDGFEEATLGDSKKVESVKNRKKQASPSESYHKTGDD